MKKKNKNKKKKTILKSNFFTQNNLIKILTYGKTSPTNKRTIPPTKHLHRPHQPTNHRQPGILKPRPHENNRQRAPFTSTKSS